MASGRLATLSFWILALGLCLGVAHAQEQPSDDATLRFVFRPNVDMPASDILTMWGQHFGALVIQDDQVQPVKLRFLTNVNADMSWGAMKMVLDFHDVVVVESQPSPEGPWVIRAHHRRNLAQKEGPPWRYVSGEDVPNHEEIVTAVFQVKHGAANSIFATVRGLLTRDSNRVGNILYVQGPEVIIIVDLASKVRYYRRVIEALDVPGPRKVMEIFPIQFAPVQELGNIVTTVLGTLAGQLGGGPGGAQVVVQQGQASQPTVIADPRTNRLIVAAFPIDMQLARDVIDELDVRVDARTGRFHVYKCKDSDAEDLAAKITELFTGRVAQPGGTGQAVPQPGAAGGALSEGGIGEVETRIVADERTNSLLIQAEERAYREILEILKQLDKKRHRVLIEAEVWEISTPTDQMTIGFEIATLTNAHDGSVRPAAATAFGLSQVSIDTDANGNPTSIGRIPNIGNGLIGVLTKDTFDRLPIIMSAVATLEEARLVTRPFAVTNDNTPSTFTISDRQPFLTTTVNNVASQQNVQFVDANSTLTIEPQVNSEDNLTLKLTLEISSFSGSGSATLPPGTNTRSYDGEVTVPNGRYVVFGGLERESERFVETKIPFLGDIPILGHLFKTWTQTRDKTKVYIFIRPTIFSNPNFTPESRLSSHMREKMHVEAGRDSWLPPIVPDRFLRPAGYDLQDEAFEVFGTGSGDPFRSGIPMTPPPNEN